jgi:hypothetical protein
MQDDAEQQRIPPDGVECMQTFRLWLDIRHGTPNSANEAIGRCNLPGAADPFSPDRRIG